MAICCSSAGGTLQLNIGGTIYSVRGSVSIMPTNLEVEAGANLDGTVYTTSKPVPSEISMNISDACGLDLTTLMDNRCTDAIVELDQVGRTYILVQADVIGRPSIDPESGEISGVKMVAQDIRTLNVEV